VIADPAAFVDLARTLDARADVVDGLRQGLAARLDRADWAGPGADRFRGEAADMAARLAGHAAGLRATATGVQQLADQLDQEIGQLRKIEAAALTWYAANPPGVSAVAPPWPLQDLPATGDPQWRQVQQVFAAHGIDFGVPINNAIVVTLHPYATPAPPPAPAASAPDPVGAGTPAQVQQWVDQAIGVLKANGVPVSNADAPDISLIIMHESGGNPAIMNTTDINWQEGHPSIGLMQTITPTFDAYALPGRGDIYNPVDNIVAGVRYALHRYGSLQNVPGVIAVHEGRSYVGY
jgi:hypothetical protein